MVRTPNKNHKKLIRQCPERPSICAPWSRCGKCGGVTVGPNETSMSRVLLPVAWLRRKVCSVSNGFGLALVASRLGFGHSLWGQYQTRISKLTPLATFSVRNLSRIFCDCVFSFRERISLSAYGWRPALSVKDTDTSASRH